MANREGIDTYIIKTATRCNLDCSYCYYYHGADTSYAEKPKFMPRAVVMALVPKIIEHSHAHGVEALDITLHGGEPLLQAKEDCEWMMEAFDEIDAAGIKTRRKLTTNGVLFDDAWGQLLSRWNTFVGVSVDGLKDAHDLYRVDHGGRGSYDRVAQGLRTALRWESEGLNVGTLTVIDPSYSGADVYRNLRSLGVRMMNFLLPEANYVHPPAGWIEGEQNGYGRYLCEVFDEWIAEDDPDIDIRFFTELVKGLAGGQAATDQFGQAPVKVAVIEADGAIEPTDNFKACSDRMTDLGLSVFNHGMDDLVQHDFFQYCLDTSSILPEECRSCEYLEVCGGGRISTRFNHDDGFQSKTIYCEDLLRLFGHMKCTLENFGLV